MAVSAYLDTLEGVPEHLTKEYKEVQDGEKKYYVLDVENGFLDREDPSVLKRAKDYEKKTRQEVEKRAKDLEAARIQLQEQLDEMRRGNIPKGDVEALERSWKQKVEELTTRYTADVTARDNTLRNLLVDSVAQKIANDVSVQPELMLPFIQKRLTTELVDGQYVTRVLDRDGKPSALTVEELQKDIGQDKRFALILKGSKASGGGASGGSNKPSSGREGGAPTVDLSKPFDWNKSTPKQIAEYQKAKKAAAENNGG